MSNQHVSEERESNGMRRHSIECMEIWGGNEQTDDAISVPGVDAFIHSRPHEGDTGGGDIHYVSMCGAGRISRFVVADVSGHGAGVSELASKLRRLMRRHINTLDQTRFARALNQEFLKLSYAGLFATAIVATYFSPTDHLIICNAGHPHPLWRRASTGAWTYLTQETPETAKAVTNLPLGVITPTTYVQFATPLEQGDMVLIYTDALPEARDAQGNELGAEGLLNMVSSLGDLAPPDMMQALLHALDEHRGGKPSNDDVTVLLLHHNGAEAPKLTIAQRMSTMARMVGLKGV